MIAVTLSNLDKRFGRTVAVDAVDLTIQPGELFFLLGPSGCGKTTLLRIIAGLTAPDRGRILFGERDVTDLPSRRRNTALVFQSYALWPHMTVEQNVAFGLEVRRIKKAERQQRINEALQRVQMTHLAQRRPPQLSGGQQQRVALARALVVQPDVLLLDEPLSNLDAKLRMEMRSTIRHICKQAHITAIYVTHDQTEALSMADRIALMEEGRICQVGSPWEIYNRPLNRFAADFLGAANFIPAEVVNRTDGHTQLQTEAGCLTTSVLPEDIPDTGNVTCCIRPEALRILEPGRTANNILHGRHLETIYLGEMAQHRFALSEHLAVVINELSPHPRQWSNPTNIGCDANDVVVLVD